MRNSICRSACVLTVLAPLAAACSSAAAAPQPARAGAEASVMRVNPTNIWNSTHETGHSQINIARPGRLAFMSGQVALTPGGGEGGKSIPHDLTDQARIVADNLAKELADVKASPRDIVMFRMYVVNGTTNRFKQAWAPIKERLGAAMPGLTGIGVQALWTPEVQLEVEMIVRVPG